jgi:rare lipoprotein A
MTTALRRWVLRLVLLGVGACQTGASRVPEAKAPAGEPKPARLEDAPAPRAEAATVPARPEAPAGPSAGDLALHFEKARALLTLKGEASYYSDKFSGRPTASGELYDPRAFTAAHRKLPFGTVVRVKRLDTGAVVYVRITDRGPFGRSRRIIDLSRAAAEELDMMHAGVVGVVVQVVKYGSARR